MLGVLLHACLMLWVAICVNVSMSTHDISGLFLLPLVASCVNASTSTCAISPPQLARRWGINPGKVLAWIKSGELRAFDVSTTPGTGKPRYRIEPSAIIEFQEKRSGETQAKPPRRRRKSPSSVIEFF